MTRLINLADNKGRNSEITFGGITKKSNIHFLTQSGESTKTIRLLKCAAQQSYPTLLKKYATNDALAEALINGDPEINPVTTGRFIHGTSRLYVNQDLKPVYKVFKTEKVYGPDGTLKEERTPKEQVSNLLAELPIKPASGGKLFPKKTLYNKFVFAKKYQLSHINGLTFDFLFEMAKELYEKDSLMMVGGGPKGVEPIVFQDGGKGYRAFLEGRIQDNKYILLLHLSNLELKPV